jgi:hypothetical protein
MRRFRFSPRMSFMADLGMATLKTLASCDEKLRPPASLLCVAAVGEAFDEGVRAHPAGRPASPPSARR